MTSVITSKNLEGLLLIETYGSSSFTAIQSGSLPIPSLGLYFKCNSLPSINTTGKKNMLLMLCFCCCCYCCFVLFFFSPVSHPREVWVNLHVVQNWVETTLLLNTTGLFHNISCSRKTSTCVSSELFQ